MLCARSANHSLLVADPVKLRLPLTLNGFRGLATILVGTTVRAALEESAKGALEFVESSKVVPGVAPSKGLAGGVNGGG